MSKVNRRRASPGRGAFIESMEGRRFLSVTPVTTEVTAVEPPTSGLLLPAVQAAREAARSTRSSPSLLPAVQEPAPTSGIIAVLIGL